MVRPWRFFFLTAITLLLIPGPAVLYIVGRSLQQGQDWCQCSESASGAWFMLLLAAFGLSALLMASAVAFSVVKYAGAAYLIVLGLRTLLADDRAGQNALVRRDTLARVFSQGVIVSVLNPKSALFFFAFLPQFVDPRRGTVSQQILMLGPVHRDGRLQRWNEFASRPHTGPAIPKPICA